MIEMGLKLDANSAFAECPDSDCSRQLALCKVSILITKVEETC